MLLLVFSFKADDNRRSTGRFVFSPTKGRMIGDNNVLP